MADFFSNLLLRSATDSFPSALLQPRLPSLFEPPVGRDETPLPAPEPVLRETIGPASELVAVNAPILQASANRSAIAVEPPERQPVITPVESRHPSEQTPASSSDGNTTELSASSACAPVQAGIRLYGSSPEEPQRRSCRAPQFHLPERMRLPSRLSLLAPKGAGNDLDEPVL
jgi:hypothetical protein